jgi:hypothetical protein
MIPWILNLLWDETVFERFGRMGIAALGQLMSAGLIPTGISGGGRVLGSILTVIPFLIGAAPQNTATVATAQITKVETAELVKP